MALELVFSRAPQPGSPTNLVFGLSDGASGFASTLTISATLPGPTVAAFIAEVARIEVAATLPGPVVSTVVAHGPPVTITASLPGPMVNANVLYSSDTQRPMVSDTDSVWQSADAVKSNVTNATVGGIDMSTGPETAWQTAQHLTTGWVHELPDVLIPGWQQKATGWEEGIKIRRERKAPHQDALRNRERLSRAKHQVAIPAGRLTSFPYQDTLRDRHSLSTSMFEVCNQLQAGFRGDLSFAAVALHLRNDPHYKEAMRPPPGYYNLPPINPEKPPCYVPGSPIKLLFQFPWVSNADLLFQCFNPNGSVIVPEEPGSSVVIPTLNFYFIVNTLYMKVVSDGSNEPVEFTDISLGTDASSWCWNFTASLTHEELDKVEPRSDGPVTIEVGINGQVWRFLVESYYGASIFGSTDYTIKGRSVTAYLDQPFAPVRSWSMDQAYNSRQIAETELTNPGLETGFDLDWNLISSTGWLMPVGSWSFQDLSPLQVINTIVTGGGGFLASHQSARQLIARPLNKYPSWDWANVATTPDLILPHTYTYGRNLQWTEKPQYNGVYVSGEQTGLNLLVKRTGYAGDFQAPMVVSPFHTSEDVIRNVGMNVLSAGGKQADVSFSMPLQEEYGLLKPGMLIEVTGGTSGAWRGMVRGTSVTASWNDQGPEVAQSATIERHYGSF